MKKNFEYPTIKVIKVNAKDIISTSGDPITGGGNADPQGPGANGFGAKALKF